MRNLVVPCLALLLPACSAPEIWLTETYEDLRYEDAFVLVRDVLDNDFAILFANPDEGRIETRWESGLVGYRRFSYRHRAVAELEGGDGAPVTVRVRVQTQSTEAPSPAYTAAEDEWEEDADDPKKARILMQRVRIALADEDSYGPSDNFEESWRPRRADEPVRGLGGTSEDRNADDGGPQDRDPGHSRN